MIELPDGYIFHIWLSVLWVWCYMQGVVIRKLKQRVAGVEDYSHMRDAWVDARIKELSNDR